MSDKTEITDFNTWTCRASALGKIISKSGKLTDGVKTYLDECFLETIYGVRREAYGTALEKGIACEEDGFKMLNDAFYPGQFVAKIKEPKANEWIKGTPDAILEGCVTDIKNALDLFTFGKADMSWVYEWQIKAYMNLYDLQKGRLMYCLNNMPDYMVAEEQRKMFYFKRNWVTMEDPAYLDACNELEKAHNYDNMPLAHRFKFWDIERSDEDDQRIIGAVKTARVYLNNKLAEHNAGIKSNEQFFFLQTV